MNDPLRALIEALRNELTQYGETLALLDQQQDALLHRSAEELLNTVTALGAQNTQMQTVRGQREQSQQKLCFHLRLPWDSQLGVMLPCLPEGYGPLVQGLVQESNELLVQMQQRIGQNHLLLSRWRGPVRRFMPPGNPSAAPDLLR
jgi:hypothetical protein